MVSVSSLMTFGRPKSSFRGPTYLIFWGGSPFRCRFPNPITQRTLCGQRKHQSLQRQKQWHENTSADKWMKLKKRWWTAGGGFFYFVTSLMWTQKKTRNFVLGVLRNLSLRVEVIFLTMERVFWKVPKTVVSTQNETEISLKQANESRFSAKSDSLT